MRRVTSTRWSRILSRAARALAQLHAGRVVHRDIKPANILIDVRRGGRVYLCDLGLGRDLEVATIEQMRDGAGTPMYMAPERLLRAPADEILCDLYSLGVTLFEALTLDRPFAVPDGTAPGLPPGATWPPPSPGVPGRSTPRSRPASRP